MMACIQPSPLRKHTVPKIIRRAPDSVNTVKHFFVFLGIQQQRFPHLVSIMLHDWRAWLVITLIYGHERFFANRNFKIRSWTESRIIRGKDTNFTSKLTELQSTKLEDPAKESLKVVTERKPSHGYATGYVTGYKLHRLVIFSLLQVGVSRKLSWSQLLERCFSWFENVNYGWVRV